MAPEPPDELRDLRAAWERAQAGDAVTAAARKRVRSWEWYSWGTRGSLMPFHAERERLPRGRRLRRPADRGDRIGRDADGRLAVVESHAGAGQVDVHLFERAGERVLELGYEGGLGGSRLAFVELWVFDGERLQRSVRFARADDGAEAWSVSDYLWRDDLLVRCETRGFDADAGRSLARAIEAGKVESFTYTPDGRLERIVEQGNGDAAEPTVRWQRPRRGDTIESLRARARSGLVGEVERTVRRAEVGEPVWCLALQYDPGDAAPPVVLLGSVRERLEWGAGVDLLNPAEWDAAGPPRRLELGGEAFLRAYAALRQTLSEAADEAGLGAFLDSAARDLNALEWRDLLPADDDFFVYAIDTESAGGQRADQSDSGPTQLAPAPRRRIPPASSQGREAGRRIYGSRPGMFRSSSSPSR